MKNLKKILPWIFIILLITVFIIIQINCITFVSTDYGETTYYTKAEIISCFLLEDENIFVWFILFQEKHTGLIYTKNLFVKNSGTNNKIITSCRYRIDLKIKYNTIIGKIINYEAYWKKTLKKHDYEIIKLKNLNELKMLLSEKKNSI